MFELSKAVDRERELSTTALVRLRDCDAFGHLHNSTFLDYFQEARDDQLAQHYAFRLADYVQQHGIGWFITTNRIQYFESVPVGMTVRIVTRLIAFDARTLEVEGRMYAEGSPAIRALYWTKMRAVDVRNGKPAEHDAPFMELCREVVYPVEGCATFEERIRALRTQPAA